MASSVLRCCCGVVKWGPVFFIAGVICWSYYAYVVEMCITNNSANIAQKVLYLLLYHPILFIFLWSYWQCIFTHTAKPPRQFYLAPSQITDLEAIEGDEGQKELLLVIAKNLPLENRTVSGAPRYCEKCKLIKPDRCHHCSVCDICVLKMDHHCPWVNNCVSFTNYKFFVLFLGYGLVYCAFIAATSLEFFIEFWTAGSEGTGTSFGRFHVLFLFFVSVMFGLSLISLFSYHCFLTFKNRSTLESFRAPMFRSGQDKNGFSLGARNNFYEIFGEARVKWFLPVFTARGDGVAFPVSVISPAPTYQTMGNTPTSTSPSLGDGVTFPTRTVDNDEDDLLGDRQRWMEEGAESNGFVGMTNKGHDNDGIHNDSIHLA